MVDLKPCPFCGEAPKTLERPDNIDGTEFVYGVMCYCGGYSATAHKMAKRKTAEQAKADAIAAWNRRDGVPAFHAAGHLHIFMADGRREVSCTMNELAAALPVGDHILYIADGVPASGPNTKPGHTPMEKMK